MNGLDGDDMVIICQRKQGMDENIRFGMSIGVYMGFW